MMMRPRIQTSFYILLFLESTSCLFPAERRTIRSSTRNHHHHHRQLQLPSSSSASSSATIHSLARTFQSPALDSDDDDDVSQRQPQRVAERPTITLPERPPMNIREPPARKKILVLGASGKIGRLVVRHLLDSEIDATIVAYCRSYDKACRVLFDDLIAVKATANRNDHNRGQGPTLQIVQGELVQPGRRRRQQDDDVSQFLSAFYNESSTSSHDAIDGHHLYPLAQAMHGASVVISCVGSTRPTHVWKDLVERPFWRLLRPNVAGWCNDGRHPYYAHYLGTQVALQLAEREEQERRRRLVRAAASAAATADNNETTVGDGAHVPPTLRQQKPKLHHQQQRLRFIRISNLSVGHAPWRLVPLVTNMLQSMVLRYHEMAEKALQDSPWVETIVLRPGDLVSWNDGNSQHQPIDYDDDEMGERDASTTAVQVGMHGWVPEPSRIGRDDVAALAVAAALFDDPKAASSTAIDNNKMLQKKTPGKQNAQDVNAQANEPPFHYTLACRWVGEQLHPFPPQGQMSDGHVDAQVAMHSALTALSQKNRWRKEVAERMDNMTTTASISQSVSKSMVPRKMRLRRLIFRRRLKPYGICVAIPTYFFLYMLASRIIQSSAILCSRMPLLQPLAQWMAGQHWLWWCRNVVAASAKFIVRRTASSRQYVPF